MTDMMNNVLAQIYGNLPDCVLIRDANLVCLGYDPVGITHLIDYELDRRRPESVQYLDGDGQEIKAELIGHDENGEEIWLEH